MKQFKKTKYFIIPIIFLILFNITLAGLVPCTGPQGTNPCNLTQLGQMLMRIITYLLGLAMTLTGVGFAWAGFLYLTSGGDSGQIKKAHDVFGKIFIGFILVCVSFLIVDLVASVFELTGPIKTLYNRLII